MQTAYATQHQEKQKESSQKVGRRPTWHFSKEDIQMTKGTRKDAQHLKYWKNANQNYKEVLPYINQNNHLQTVYKW